MKRMDMANIGWVPLADCLYVMSLASLRTIAYLLCTSNSTDTSPFMASPRDYSLLDQSVNANQGGPAFSLQLNKL